MKALGGTTKLKRAERCSTDDNLVAAVNEHLFGKCVCAFTFCLGSLSPHLQYLVVQPQDEGVEQRAAAGAYHVPSPAVRRPNPWRCQQKGRDQQHAPGKEECRNNGWDARPVGPCTGVQRRGCGLRQRINEVTVRDTCLISYPVAGKRKVPGGMADSKLLHA